MGRRDGVQAKGVLRRRLIQLLLVAATAFMLVSRGAAPAVAAPRTIAEWGHGAGRVNLPFGAAVDQTGGDLYVAEWGNFRVDKFDPEGQFLLAWGYGVADGRSEDLQSCGPAASPPSGRCFAPNFNSSNGGNPDNNLRARSVVVDQSSGDVYVADPYRVSKFTPSGHLIYMVGKNVNKTKREEAGATQAEKDICTASSGDVCRSGDSGTGANEFSGAVLPLAVSSSGVVWVGDKNRLVSFDSNGSPGAEIAVSGGAGDTVSLALDSAGHFYVKSDSLPGIRKLEGGTGTPLETLDEAGHARTVTLDEAGDVFVGDSTAPYRFMVYDPAGEQISQFGAGQVRGTPGGGGATSGSNAIAVGQSAGELYVASSWPASDSASAAEKEKVAVQAFPLPKPGPLPEAERAEEVLPTTATLKASLNPEGHETTYRFEYDTAPYEGEAPHGTKVPVPDATLPGSEYEGEEVQAELEGLIPSTTYHFRLVATNSQGTVYGEDATFTTLPAIGIEAQWATDISAHDATLHAKLDPLGVEGPWWLEYGPSSCEGGGCARAAEGTLPASSGEVPLAVALSGLSPATTYHYRFAAEDHRDGHAYLVHGQERTFTTQLAGLGFTLPDNRAWEMVSPPDKHGGRISAPDGAQGGQVQAAADGEALAYLSYGSLEADPEGSRLIEQSSELSRRGPGGAWGSTDLTAPHTTPVPFTAGAGLEYKLFSTNLDRALMEPRDCTPLSPLATERTPYLRENTAPPTYTPLVNAADVEEGTPPLGGDCLEHVFGAVGVVDATPDLSHIVLGSSVPLLEGGGPYEWVGGAIRRLNFKPDDEGGGAFSAVLGSGEFSTRGAVSEDGSRYFLSGAVEGGLYVRDVVRQQTIRLDKEQPGAFGTGKVQPLFQAANAAGTVAFFTDTQNLTEDANEEGADLYRWTVEGSGGCGEAGGCLEDLTAGVANFGESAEVQGLLPGVAEGGSSAYLVARGVLASNEGAALEPASGEHEVAAPGQPNLYLWRAGEGMRFVARLAGEDERDWGWPADGKLGAFKVSAAASPDGRYLAFMSAQPLTGYDNRDAGSGERVQEVYRYDSVTGDLTCASCEPSGARPHALVPGAEAGELSEEFDPNRLWGGVEVAAVVPEAMKTTAGGVSLYRPRFIQDDGRLFFNAADSLVAADSNGNGDVYEYEPTGTGTCGPSSGDAGTALIPGGCLSLISSGTAEGTAAFLDASEGARDVFFYSPARLSVTDEDGELDVYDAREAGEPARSEPIAECLGEACQPPATPPEAQTPASAAFRGPANPRLAKPPHRCPKGRQRVRRHGKARCVKRHRKRHGRHHHRAHRRHKGRSSR